jgi:transcriptional regulator MraZ
VLLGEFVQKLDAKNRFTLPARYRSRFADGVVVTKGLDGCLVVFNKAGWESFAESWLQRLDPLSREGRLVSRFVFAGASEGELDGQGRVMLPQPLMEHAGLSRDIVVAGVRDFLEVWDLEAWKRVQTESEGSVEDVTERLSQH